MCHVLCFSCIGTDVIPFYLSPDWSTVLPANLLASLVYVLLFYSPDFIVLVCHDLASPVRSCLGIGIPPCNTVDDNVFPFDRV